ncbi:MAG: hypothetical protein CMD81_11395 [Gammaproteobacteria bacterium]|nr:hypothetical protein [Gammaproteobacteria bacterium]|tara:strand:+ start:21226 stop:21690 length:465 start_codon:yes stop_codon:yes gene_type:complete
MNKRIETEIKEVSNLIDINNDACEFYKKAEEKVEDQHLRSEFVGLRQLHSNVVTKLQSEIASRNVKPEDIQPSETVAGKANRYFGELMAAITPDTDARFISRLEEAEDRCLHSMEDVVKNQDISSELKTVLMNQYDELKKSHDHMRTLKKIRAA